MKKHIPNSINRYMDKDMYMELKSNKSFDISVYDVLALQDFVASDDSFKFGDIIISKLKFLRNYSILKDKFSSDYEKVIFNSLIYGSILDDDELDIISNQLNDSVLKLKKC